MKVELLRITLPSIKSRSSISLPMFSGLGDPPVLVSNQDVSSRVDSLSKLSSSESPPKPKNERKSNAQRRN